MDVLLRMGRDGDVEASIVGTMTCAVLVPSAEVAGFVGIRFRPGEALAFLDVAADAVRDTELTPIEAGLGDVDDLIERIANKTSRHWPRALDGWLLARFPRARPADARVRRAVDVLVAARGSTRVSDLAAHVDLSERHLERAFAERVGVSPKLLARVLRLRALLRSLDSTFASVPPGNIPWAGLAAECGFADQAHLVREVRALAGVTPTALVRERMSDLFNTRGDSDAI